MPKLFSLLFILIAISGNVLLSQYSISAFVADSLTGIPLQNVKAELFGTNKITYSDENGKFRFSAEHPGIFTITVSMESYESYITTLNLSEDVKTVDLYIKLSPFHSYTDTIDVDAKFYKKAVDVSTSYFNTQYEEIRKNPGSFEDVVKYYTTAPGVVTGNDNYNQLLVRGGAPFENLILIDGFEIPNPNHYGPPGSSNGALSFVNSRLIGEVDFYTGGFPARYGDKLSSVMDIKFRKGNSDKHIRDINISVTGFGGFFEGPFTKKGSYMFAARKSYFELVKDKLATDLLPDYWDLNGKLSLKVSTHEDISFTGLYVIDHAEAYRNMTGNENDSVDMVLFNGSVKYSNEEKKHKFSSVTGYSISKYDVKYQLYDLEIKDRYVSSAQSFTLHLNRTFDADIVTGLKYYFSEYKIYHSNTVNESNYFVPGLNIDTEVKTVKLFGGINLTSTLVNGRLTLNTGVRVDYFGYMNKPYSISPRFGGLFRLWDNTNITANAGIYFQAPELSWLVTYTENRDLDYIRCDEAVLGIEHFLGYSMKLSAEAYLKQYYNYPVSVFNPYFIFINNGVSLYPNFLDRAVSAGKGYYTGIDIVLEKKNSGTGLYWSAAYSFSHSKFLSLVGDFQPLEFDVGSQFNLIAGYKFKFGLSLSGHFKYTGGRPYTPYDIASSEYNGHGIFIMEEYNKARMPEYVRLDMRVEQQLHPWNTDLTVYVEVLNVLDRKNLFQYGWNFGRNELEEFRHFFRLPVIGVSWKF